jgi:hypothetical protein
MESHGIQYSVVQSGGLWRWLVHLRNELKTGYARNRSLAVLAAIKAINKAAQQDRAEMRAAARKLPSRVE